MAASIKICILFLLICLAIIANSEESKYESQGPCKYCKYCAFCDECKHCPCVSDPNKPNDLPYCEYCTYCKYCSYCKLCDYCEEGGALSRLTKSVASIADSVLNLFQPKDRDLAEKAQQDFTTETDPENDERLKQERLEEIEKKYKDKLKKEI